jgi:hypothetical protein
MKEVVVDKGQRPIIKPIWLTHHVKLKFSGVIEEKTIYRI